MEYCTVCGLKGKPVEATGVDEDGEPACFAHKALAEVKASTTFRPQVFDQTSVKCVRDERCTRKSGHVGKCGWKPKKGETSVVSPIRKKTLRLSAPVQSTSNSGEASVVPESSISVPLSCGEMTLTYKGDAFSLLQSHDDLNFVQALLNVIKCRGKLMHPFSDTLKDKKTGKMLTVQMDEGFVDDMVSMMEPEDKALVLQYVWTKGLGN